MFKTKIFLLTLASVLTIGTLTGCKEEDPVAVKIQDSKEYQEFNKKLHAPASKEDLKKTLYRYHIDDKTDNKN